MSWDWDDDEALFAATDGAINLRDFYSPKQLAITNDHSNNRVVIGGRRSSKSTIFGGEAIEVADQFPGTTVPYLANTIGRARDIMMPHFDKFVSMGVQLRFNRSEFKVFTPNGGCVQLGGLATKAEVEKGRGGSYPALYIDECGSIPTERLRPAVLETYGPATKDWFGIGGRGIALGGTPDYVPLSYWSKICGGNSHESELGWSVHHMTIWDNPFFEGREQGIIDAYCEENGLEPSDPEVQREWYGKFCMNTEGLAYPHWDGSILPMVQMPIAGYTVLGVDLGTDHPCAFVVVRFTVHETLLGQPGKERLHTTHHAHVLETYEESGLSVHDVRAIIATLQRNYNVSLTVGDSAGGGAMTIQTIGEVMGTPIKPVVKSNLKEDRIWMTDSMLRNRTLHVYERCETLVEQLGSVPIERAKNGRIDHMKGYHDHSLDALHYALVAARQHEVTIELPPVPGSREWQAQQQAREARVIHESAKDRARRIRRAARLARIRRAA